MPVPKHKFLFMETFKLDNYTKNINPERRYWLVRTMGGDYYPEYKTRGFIAIGYNPISLKDIKYAISKGKDSQKALIEISLSHYGEMSNNSYKSAQLLTFTNDMKIGDIVIMPARISGYVSLGEITGDVYEETNISKDIEACQFSKRRNVRWIKEYNRNKLNPKLQLIFASRHIISNIDKYSLYIDSFINDFYKKDNETFLVLKVKEEDDISGSDITFISDILSVLDDYSRENQLQVTSEDIKVKISLQSPGDILMHAFSSEGIMILGLIIMIIKSGSFSYNKEEGVKISTNDIFQSISEFLDRRRDRKFKSSLQKKLDSMKIDNPEDLINIIEAEKNKRKEY